MASLVDIVTNNVNNYDKFLDKSSDPDRVIKRTNFENRLNFIYGTITSNSNLDAVHNKLFQENFNRVIKLLCAFKEGEHRYGFSTIERLVDKAIDELEANVNLLNVVINDRDIRNIINKYNLHNKVDFIFDNVIVNGSSIKTLVSGGVNPADVASIVSGIEEYVEDTKRKYKEETLKIIQKYMENAQSVLSINNDNANEQMRGSFTNFSTELSLKNLYVLLQLDTFVNNNFTSIIGSSNISEEIQSNMDQLWVSIKPTNIDQITATKELHPDVMFPDRINGHNLYAILTNFIGDNEKVKTFIKYKMMLLYSDENQRISSISEEDMVTAKDVMLIFRDFKLNEAKKEISGINSNIVLHSNDFDGERYSVEHLDEDDVRFNIAFAVSVLEALYHELKGYSSYDVSNVPSKYIGIKKVYSDDLDNLIKDTHYESVLDSVIGYSNNSLLLDLDKKEFYNLIRYFSFDEIKWMVEEIDKSPRSSSVEEKKSELKQLIYYCSFFKTYEEDNIKFDSPKYERINKLFNMIKTTNDVSLLGRQFEEWFKSIDINSLSEEEFEVLSNVDYQFIYNQLDYASQVIYQKCKKYGVKFHMGYKDMIYSAGVNVDETVKDALDVIYQDQDEGRLYPKFDTINVSENIDNIFRIFKDSNAIIPGYLWNMDYEYLEEYLRKHKFDLNLLPQTYVPIIFSIPDDELSKYVEAVGGDFNNLLYIPSGSDLSIFDGVQRVVTMYGVNYSDIPSFPMEAFRCSEARLGFLKKVFDNDIEKLKKLPGVMYSMKYDDLLKIVKKKKSRMFDDRYIEDTLVNSNHSSDERYGGFYREFKPLVKGDTIINVKVSPFFRNYCAQFSKERLQRQKLVLARTNSHKKGNFVMTDYMLFGSINTFRLLLHLSDDVDMFFGLNPSLFEVGRGKLEYLINLFGNLKLLNKMPSSFFHVPMETTKLIVSHPMINGDINKLRKLPSTFFDIIYYNGMDLDAAFKCLDMLKEIEECQKTEDMVPLDGKGIMINVKLVNDFLGKEEYEFKDYMLYRDTYELINLLPMFHNVYESNPMFKTMGLTLEDILVCLRLDINLIDNEEKIKEQVLTRIADIMKEKGTINISGSATKK